MFTTQIKSLPEEDISLLVALDNHPHKYMIDCGFASSYSVKDYLQVSALFLSHLHMDHFIGFDTMMRHQVGSGKKIIVCGPRGTANQLSSKLRAYTWNLVDHRAVEYEVREFINPDLMYVYSLVPPIWETGLQQTIAAEPIFSHTDLSVSAIVLDHKTDSVAYRFDAADRIKIDLRGTRFYGGPWVGQLKDAFAKKDGDVLIDIDQERYAAKELFNLLRIEKGHSLGFIMDHAATPENHQKIKEHFNGCHEVYIECYFRNADQALAAQHGHSFSKASAEVLRAAKVHNATPIHFSRKYSSEERKELEEEFYRYFNDGKK